MSKGSVAPLIKEYYPEYYMLKEYPIGSCAPIRTNTDEWGILSNIYPTVLVVDGVEFASSEQLFQMMKFSDKDILLDIYKTRGMTPKMKAKKIENRAFIRPDWGQVIIDCMKFCLQTKYDQCEDFKNTLHNTKGLNIVEDETNRKTSKKGNVRPADTWGVIKDGDMYKGSNLMGRLLMELRDNGKLEYHLPDDIFDFISILKSSGRI